MKSDANSSVQCQNGFVGHLDSTELAGVGINPHCVTCVVSVVVV